MTWLALLTAAALVNILAAEIFDWCPWLAERLIRRAVRKLPFDVRERYLEEWLAELDAVPGRGISLLVFAALVLAGASKVCQEIAGSRRSSVAGLAFKRTFDGAFALTSLLFFSPILLYVALAVRFTSRGPVLFRSMRPGIGQVPFARLRFRTIYTDAEHHQRALQEPNEAPDALFNIRDDSRTTRVGKLLQSYSLDGLPQLINVLRGEMSLVGPQPDPPWFAEQHAQSIPRYGDRYLVKPGLTGLAQLYQLRGSISAAERTELDIYYVNHRSLWLDLKILALTFLALLREAE